MAEKYSRNMDSLAGFGFLVNALESRGQGDGDRGASFPRSDAEDMSRGARFIPGDVTLARRRGEKVRFISECSANCWHWVLPDGNKIFHFDSMTYDSIGRTNKRKVLKSDGFGAQFEDGAGPCPHCGNPHTNGGRVTPDGKS